MKPLFDINNLSNYLSHDKLFFICKQCSKTFLAEKKNIVYALNPNNIKSKATFDYCSKSCVAISRQKRIITTCSQCSEQVITLPSKLQKSKSGNSFCNNSCAAIYRNAHKIKGIRRSKLEHWLETKLIENYPELEFIFNGKQTINSELDIYVPSLKLAFELNGIFHYEPIYGLQKLASIKNNDNRKFQACLERNIELVIIDSSNMSNFKLQKALQYLQIITSIINMKDDTGLAPIE